MAEDRVTRYLSRVDMTSDCWIWRGPLTTGGAPRVAYAGRYFVLARFIWEAATGEDIPEGLVLDHLCRNRACVNPAHLEPVTNRENILRGVGPTALNAQKLFCTNGHPIREQRECLTCRRRAVRDYMRRRHLGWTEERIVVVGDRDARKGSRDR